MALEFLFCKMESMPLEQGGMRPLLCIIDLSDI